MKKYFVIQVFVFLMLINCPMQAQLQFASHTIAGGEFAPVDPGSILAVDLDKDGDIDILSSGNNDNRLAWYENDGNENFYSHIITYGVPNCASIFACDLDSDGDIDILSASDKIDWFENDGQQNFQTHTLSTFYASTKQFGCVYAIDLDNDGDMDVLSVSDKINWYENYGTKHFGTHLISAEVYNAQCVYAADVDNDGDIDVLCASSESYPTYPAKVAWYENDSNQNFKEHTIVKGTGNVFSVVAADIDSDGDTDIISTFSGPYNDKFCWFENDSHQNFSAHAIDDSAWGANFACAVDMDGDMDLDILLAAYQNKIAWFENDGNANYIEHKISESLSVQSVFPVDIDGDGDMDVIAGVSSWEFSNHEILWFENGGSEKFNCQSILSSPGFIGSFYITDLDNDGRDDVLTDYSFSYHGIGDYLFPPVIRGIGWYKNNNTGYFRKQTIASRGKPVVVTDFDKDGDNDLFSASGDLFAPDLGWLENDGKENFISHIIDTSLGYPLSAFVEDIDGDSDLDIICSSVVWGPPSYIYWYENDGNQNLSRHLISSGSTYLYINGSDLDSDGDIDFLSTDRETNIFWFENDGNGNFKSKSISDTVGGKISVVDLDSDGDMDILCSSFWFENDGDQKYLSHRISPEILFSTTGADLDGDGDLDLLAGTYEFGIVYFENNGSNVFSIRVLGEAFEFFPESFRIQTADWDNDGDIDVIFNSFNSIIWYENLAITNIVGNKFLIIPKEYRLEQNYPNPFNAITNFEFRIANFSHVNLSIYDILGQKVATLVNKKQAAGNYQVQWDASGFATGVYYYKLTAGDPSASSVQVFQQVKKMILIK